MSYPPALCFALHIYCSQLYFITSLKKFHYTLDQIGFMSFPGGPNSIYYVGSIWKHEHAPTSTVFFPADLQLKGTVRAGEMM